MDLPQRLAGSSQGGGLLPNGLSFWGRLSSRTGADEELLQIGIRREIPDQGLNGADVQGELLGEGGGTGVLQEIGATNLEVPVRRATGFLEGAGQSVGTCHESIKW